jgi:DNA-binding transcriptional MerR regulator
MSNFNIQVVSDICGISDHTLRAWERRYGVVDPERSDGGQRLYSQQDLDKLQLLSYLVSQGHRISKLAKMNDEELNHE